MQAVIASIFSLEFQIAQLVFYWPDTRNTFTLALHFVGRELQFGGHILKWAAKEAYLFLVKSN